MFIVSRNYRDRESPFKWLIRKATEAIENAKAYKNVIAERVTFSESSDGERGFGCRVVAIAESATGSDPELTPVALKFVGYEFQRTDTGESVEEVDVLELKEDGSMLATISDS